MTPREILKKFLAESTVEERSAIWAEVKGKKLGGPTLSEYFAIVENQLHNSSSYLTIINRLYKGSVTIGDGSKFIGGTKEDFLNPEVIAGYFGGGQPVQTTEAIKVEGEGDELMHQGGTKEHYLADAA